MRIETVQWQIYNEEVRLWIVLGHGNEASNSGKTEFPMADILEKWKTLILQEKAKVYLDLGLFLIIKPKSEQFLAYPRD